MSRRFLVIALVFAVGFGVGLGATWLLVGSPDKAPQPIATPAPTAPTAPVAVTTPPPAETSEPPATHVAEADAGATPEADGAAPSDAPPADDSAVAVPSEAPDTAVAVAAPDVAAPVGGDADAWWNRCHGKVCLVDWGRVSGGISVRDGTIEHGEEVDWSKTFAKADKVGTIEAKKNMKVEVLAIGMVDGKPGAAWIKYRKTKGVIALTFGDKSISFKPLER